MNWRLVLFVTVVLAITGNACPLVAQPTYDVRIEANTHVRLVSRDSGAGRVEGHVVRLANDTIVVRNADALVGRALGDLSAIELRGGRDRMRGMVYGAAAALAITGVAGGIDVARGGLRTDELLGLLLGNAFACSVVGYFLAPTGWQRIPIAPSGSR